MNLNICWLDLQTNAKKLLSYAMTEHAQSLYSPLQNHTYYTFDQFENSNACQHMSECIDLS